jgi:hypothetical protein
MPTQVQFRRGTTAQNNSFTGAAGEISVNTSNNTIRVHDGVVAGGYELARRGNVSVLTTGTSAELAAVISDETGSGVLVFGTSPAITTSLTTPSASFDLINTTATTVNLAGASTAITIGASTGTMTLRNPTIVSSTTSVNIFNTVATTVNFAGAATTLSLGAGTGTTTVNNSLVVTGDLTVNGTTTTINAVTLTVDDKNIELGSVATPSDITADGGGITLKGATDKSINWISANSAWTSSEDFNLVTGKVFEINGTSVLSASTLGSGVTVSSLTSFGSSPVLVTPNIGTPSYAVLTNASGTASNLTANITNFINVTDDTTTNATRYPIFANGTSGAITEQVSSTKLFFNPSTGLLTSTDYNSSSDKRLKKNIRTLSSALDTVASLRGVTFEWKEGGGKSIGLIAQEVKEVVPDIVVADDNGYLGIKYTNIIGILVEAIKEQQDQINTLKKLIEKQ